MILLAGSCVCVRKECRAELRGWEGAACRGSRAAGVPTGEVCLVSPSLWVWRRKSCLSPAMFVLCCPRDFLLVSLPSRLVIYGQYCSAVESAISSLDYISKTKEDVKLKLEVPVVLSLGL